MSRSNKVRLFGILAFVLVSINVFWLQPLSSIWAHETQNTSRVQTTSSLPYNQYANGPYTVQGTTIRRSDGKPYLFHGIGRDSLEYDCKGDGFFDAQHLAYMGSGTNGRYDRHPYPYSGEQPSNWDASFGTISNTYAVISAESGEYDCGTSYMSQLLSYFDAHKIGWISWSWVSAGSVCKYPQLITDYSGMPSANLGIFIYQYLRGYASVPAARRVTEWVDGDLATSPTGPGISDAAIITADTTSTPNCSGIVAERPMDFNALGTDSGSDVIGYNMSA